MSQGLGPETHRDVYFALPCDVRRLCPAVNREIGITVMPSVFPSEFPLAKMISKLSILIMDDNVLRGYASSRRAQSN